MEGLILFFLLLVTGYIFGSLAEKRHYRSIRERERRFLHLPAVTLRAERVTGGAEILDADLVYGSAVISVDYFKRILAGLRNLFGGAIRSYETLIDRARREALLRMKAMAPEATLIVNVRVETAVIGASANKKTVGSVEVLAYGTALTLKRP
jgi:uncharacterized protein YbjQ (UPF0145 family)